MDWRSATAFTFTDASETAICQAFTAPPEIQVVPEPEPEIVDVELTPPGVLACAHSIENDCSVTVSWEVITEANKPVNDVEVSLRDGLDRYYEPNHC
jgi:hypothetical protein